jgi:hypothetical protein
MSIRQSYGGKIKGSPWRNAKDWREGVELMTCGYRDNDGTIKYKNEYPATPLTEKTNLEKGKTVFGVVIEYNDEKNVEDANFDWETLRWKYNDKPLDKGNFVEFVEKHGKRYMVMEIEYLKRTTKATPKTKQSKNVYVYPGLERINGVDLADEEIMKEITKLGEAADAQWEEDEPKFMKKGARRIKQKKRKTKKRRKSKRRKSKRRKSKRRKSKRRKTKTSKN